MPDLKGAQTRDLATGERKYWRVIDLAGGVVQNHDQVMLTIIIQPLMRAPVNMQNHPRHGPAWTPSAVRPTLVSFGHQAGSLQGFLYQGVAQLDRVLVLQLFVEVPYVQVVKCSLYSLSSFSAAASGDAMRARFPLRRSASPE